MKTFSEVGIVIPEGTPTDRQFRTTCPQPDCSPKRHKTNDKCLSVSIEKGAWCCFHCGWQGNLVIGTQHKSNPDTPSEKNYYEPEYPENVPVLPTDVIEWFRARKILETTLARNMVGFSAVYYKDKGLVNAIRFPFYRAGKVVNIKSRTIDKMFRLEQNAEIIFYGMDDCKGDSVIIVEGEIDKLSVEEAGFSNCVSVPNGASSFSAPFLKNCEAFINSFNTVIIAVDNDEPGKALEDEIARRIGKHRCRRVTWPKGCKDANDVLVKEGRDVLEHCLNNSVEYPVEGIFHISDLVPHIRELYDKGHVRGVSTGWESVDEYYTVRPGEMTIVTGVPSHGKSEWLDALMVNVAKSSKWNFAIFSPENQPLEEHFAKIAEKYIGKPFFIGIHDRMTWKEVEEAIGFTYYRFSFVLPPGGQRSIDGILELAKIEIQRRGVNGIVIDPWNELDHSRPASMTETEYISYALSKIRRLAREYQAHVWVIAHPTKLQKKDDGTYPVPNPYDISGSAHWKNKADNCISVYRLIEGEMAEKFEDQKHEVEIYIQKVRFKSVGKFGKVKLQYDPITGRYK